MQLSRSCELYPLICSMWVGQIGVMLKQVLDAAIDEDAINDGKNWLNEWSKAIWLRDSKLNEIKENKYNFLGLQYYTS